jgi:pimeloyl-ACP methyl ester carboxylesterase
MWLSFAVAALLLAADEAPEVVRDSTDLGVGFHRYTTKDSFDRTITFYLSSPLEGQEIKRLPLALLIQGSGCQSLWRKRGEQITGGQQNLLRAAAKGRVRVLVVEKPGVKFLDEAKRPGSAEGASEEFLNEHTLPRWAEANRAAMRAAWTLPGVDSSKTLVVGHSEGGIVAALLAAEMPEVTHVASLAGGGPTQLYSLAESRGLARADDKPGDANKRIESMYREWAEVQKDPDSRTKFWLGHPHRRWSSFLKTSVAAELLRSKAKVFLAQGDRDASVPPTAHDVLIAELRASGRDVVAERVEDADHGFRLSSQATGSPEGMQALFGRVLDSFLQEDINP